MDENNLLWDVLKKHFGHHVEIAVYGDVKLPHDVCLECMDCNEVVLDAEIYTLTARKENRIVLDEELFGE